MYAEIAQVLNSIGQPKVLIVGDIMLDEFLSGSVNRISPEAPTPVLAYQESNCQLGGAGFTSNVLAQLNADVEICAVTGNDETRQSVIKLLDSLKVKHRCLVQDDSRPTTRKQRVMAQDKDISSGQQQILRIDYESKEAISSTIENQIISFLDEKEKEFDAIIISDYQKGVLTENVLQRLRVSAKHCTVIADPAKGAPIERYKGITAMKPNRHECEAAVGFPISTKEDIIRAGKILLEKADLQYALISLDTDGIFYINRKHEFLFVPTQPLQVYDVAGAGDSVISIMALLSTVDIAPRYLLETANAAAGIMISQQSPKHISREDLVHRMVIDKDEFNNKIKNIDELEIILKSSSTKNKDIYFTNGYYDNVSRERILYLEKLNEFDGIRIVAINSDTSIKNQGHEPQLRENDRLRLLQLFDCIDYILIFDEADCTQALERLKPHYFLKGKNFEGKTITESKTLEKINCQIKFIDIYS
ncbi:PfkB family carbohydrate kinase [Lentisphaera profundi]|uniref:PfkB family carbohydrate kinase n=1 Tax=Lentisphaera profundi TaxID=1658616 RepID=A0ABY7VTJ5_9BACT|nr:PfkB family carbohydrate kinase [Lentisphaera profundi]WDE95458.1 PfkB family carbohydrate kinase [Lentisphaera profundi]